MRRCQHPDCGAEIEPPKRRWCSIRCYRDWRHDQDCMATQAQRQRTLTLCPTCQAPVLSPGQRGQLRTYCSRRCRRRPR